MQLKNLFDEISTIQGKNFAAIINLGGQEIRVLTVAITNLISPLLKARKAINDFVGIKIRLDAPIQALLALAKIDLSGLNKSADMLRDMTTAAFPVETAGYDKSIKQVTETAVTLFEDAYRFVNQIGTTIVAKSVEIAERTVSAYDRAIARAAARLTAYTWAMAPVGTL